MLKGKSAKEFIKKADENLSKSKTSFKKQYDIMKLIINKAIKKNTYGN